MIRKTRIRRLAAEELDCLTRFGRLEISLEHLRRCLHEVFEFDFDVEGGKGWSKCHFIVPEPGVVITKKDLENALDKRRRGFITERQLVEWATVVLHNHAYELEAEDEDLIADWLNDISFDLNRSPE